MPVAASDSPPAGSTFDYVVIGGGSAGCVLANRLSSDSSLRICLVEPGPADRNPIIHVPLGFLRLFTHKNLNWRFFSTPQAETGPKPIYVPRGRVLGGTSAINAMIYMRGHPADYDDWAAMGNAGWSFADVLPYFKRSENNTVWRNSPYHGVGGLLNVTDLGRPNKMGRVFIEAAESLQFRQNSDFNNGVRQEGFGFRQVTQRNGRRESAATAFLKPAMHRANLTVLTHALATRILLKDGRAVGAELLIQDRPRQLHAAREVIACAGAVGSPLLLMRSGVGDGDELRRNGVAVNVHLPGVGRNFHDHTAATIDVDAPGAPSYGISVRAVPSLVGSVVEYALFRRGMFASNVVEAGGFVRTDSHLERPNIQLTFMSARRGAPGRMGHGHGYGLSALLLRPRSRGRIRVIGADPRAEPYIDVGSFKDESDLDELLQGAKLARRILNTPAFARFHANEERPGQDVRTEEQLREYIRHNSGTGFHPVGSCKMGNDAGAVVDAALRVRGVERLRVVDASIMPSIIGGNTNAPTIMIAEKAADMILGRPPLPPETVA